MGVLPFRFRSRDVARRLLAEIRLLAKELDGKIKIMTFCGTHEHTVMEWGIRWVMPENVDIVAGPGCPVCITPAAYIDYCCRLALEDVTVYTYGDVYKVPGLRYSLAKARSMGGRVKVVYSFLDAIKDAHEQRGVCVFFAVGFETTQPSVSIRLLRGKVPRNLKILSAFRLTPPIMRYMLDRVKVRLDGVIAPGHVSTIIGAGAWSFLPEEYGVPTVVAGFEPLDVLLAVREILYMIVRGVPRLVNEYRRVVPWGGNRLALESMSKVFDIVDAYWRGIGSVPLSGLELKGRYRDYDARELFGDVDESVEARIPGCRCSEVILGLAKPVECPLFLKACTPENPRGPCMVSSEGTCRIWAKFGGYSILKRMLKT